MNEIKELLNGKLCLFNVCEDVQHKHQKKWTLKFHYGHRAITKLHFVQNSQYFFYF